ncbi:hypothetical protein VNO80_18664 [Phaseolus coccineus]|uniref:Uncharacterized protein n=1 Tax=Phaseolus coccineus TaxID=3886 RepID=A0AAN9R417_PHACN
MVLMTKLGLRQHLFTNPIREIRTQRRRHHHQPPSNHRDQKLYSQLQDSNFSAFATLDLSNHHHLVRVCRFAIVEFASGE